MWNIYELQTIWRALDPSSAHINGVGSILTDSLRSRLKVPGHATDHKPNARVSSVTRCCAPEHGPGNRPIDLRVTVACITLFLIICYFFSPLPLHTGRKKSNKYNSLLMYPFMMGGMTIPLAFGVLALLAGKALIIAKLALVLSAIVGLKKLFADDHGSSHEYVTHAGGHYRRSLPGEPIAAAASNMAYSSYMPVYEEPIRSSTTNAIPL